VISVDLFINLATLVKIAYGKPIVSLVCEYCFAGESDKDPEYDPVPFQMKYASRLVATEASEFLLPLALLGGVFVAYRGCNAKRMVGIGLSEFGEPSIDDFSNVACSIALMLLGDLLVTGATKLVMRKFDINLFSYYAAQLELYWVQTSISQCWVVSTVFCSSVVHCMIDFSFRFQWTHWMP